MNKLPPICEFYDDQMQNLDMFFSNGKKEFWRFDKIKEKGIDKCIFFFPRHFKEITTVYEKCKKIYEFKSASTLSPVYLYDNKVLIALCPLGGPAAANLMEELIYIGIKQFIGVGTCGSLEKVDYDTYLVPHSAIRDEGLSYHYLPPSRMVETDEQLAKQIIDVLKKRKEHFNYGVTWTTDAIYRETPLRIEARRRDGATGVEMETASLAAVAKAKGVQYACLLYYSDYNNGRIWETRVYDRIAVRSEIIDIAVEALLNK